jgi:amino acid adenylation domain-containing protein/thioester reductase-like protein
MRTITTFHHLLEYQAIQRPTKVAVKYYHTSMNYQELNRKSNQFARYLQNQGVKRGGLIGLYFNRCLELPIIFFGVLKCGAVCVPIDASANLEQIKRVLNNTNPCCIIVHDFEPRSLPEYLNIKTIYFKQIELSKYSDENLQLSIDPHDLALILFTSGSTSNPKGVELEHKGIVNLAFQKIKPFNIDESYNILQFSSISFDALISELGIQMVTGGTLVIVQQEDLLPGKILINTLNNYKINLIIMAPSILKTIQNASFSHLRIIMSAGEACPPALANKLSHKFIFVNAYGPTEASVCTTMYYVNMCKKYRNKVPIGKPIDGINIKILNKDLKTVEPHQTGELFIGGIGIARGYHNDSELTAKSFITISGERFYKTGDLVRFLNDGNIEYIGRIDRQVKYHGIKINLDEIEQVTIEHEYIETAAAIFYDDILSLFVQLKSNETLGIKEIRSYLRSKLPLRIIPTQIFLIPRIKLTLSNKIDYQALSRLIISQYKPKYKQGSIDKSITQQEKDILNILKKLIISDQIDLDTDFFDLGLNSFSVVNFIDKINQKLNINLQIRTVYEYPTIRQMVAYIKNPEANQSDNTIDFTKEILADKAIPKKSYTYIPNKFDNPNIFLTGATGFVGIFFLDKVLHNTNSVVYCLIRVSNKKTALDRLKISAKKYKINISWKNYLPRIKFIVGDLSKAFFGLKEKEFYLLSQNIDIIYHLGCDTSFIKPYIALKPTNINGSQEILRFATQTKVIPVHYISTLAIFSCRHFFEKIQQIDEKTDSVYSADYLRYDIGYVQTKWVADQLMQQAIRHGIPVTIYRPGFILCHSKTGVKATDHFWHSFIKECVHLGKYPLLINQKEEFVSVDYVCKALLYLSKIPESVGSIYHLCPKAGDNIDNSECLEKLSQFLKCSMEQLEYSKWLKLVIKDLFIRKDDNLYLFLPLLRDKVYKNLTTLELYQNTPNCLSIYTTQLLENAKISPDTMELLLKRYAESISIP